MRFFAALLAILSASPALAETTDYPATNGNPAARMLVVYSSLDRPLPSP